MAQWRNATVTKLLYAAVSGEVRPPGDPYPLQSFETEDIFSGE